MSISLLRIFYFCCQFAYKHYFLLSAAAMHPQRAINWKGIKENKKGLWITGIFRTSTLLRTSSHCDHRHPDCIPCFMTTSVCCHRTGQAIGDKCTGLDLTTTRASVQMCGLPACNPQQQEQQVIITTAWDQCCIVLRPLDCDDCDRYNDDNLLILLLQ